MQKIKKLSIYDLNPRYFKDQDGDGKGDLRGLANKFSYLDFLGVETIMLQDVIGTGDKTTTENFKTIASDIGTVNDLTLVISHAQKYGIKVFIELKIGSINEQHAWFKNATVDKTEEFESVVEFSAKKDHDTQDVQYKFDNNVQGYYPINEQTSEIPLNWKSEYVLKAFLDVIKFWTSLGISGFVFRDFEYVGDKSRSELMNIDTLREMRKFYNTIKEVDHEIYVIGKSDIIELKDAQALVTGTTQIFDYFQSTKVSRTGADGKFLNDQITKFSPKKLFKKVNTIAKLPSSIVSLGSELTGRITSRWGDDGQFNAESAKSLAMLSMLSPASFATYYGDELGMKNIQLTHLDDFQDEDLEMRKKIAIENKISEKDFMDAQVLQAPINARSLMAWNEGKNSGFSIAAKTVTPVSADYYLNNVEFQFNEKNSILNFNKRLIAFVKSGKFKSLLEKATFKASVTLSGVEKFSYVSEDGEWLTAFINLSESRKMITKPKAGEVIFSSYADKDYNELPKALEPFESIVIVEGAGFPSLKFDKPVKAPAEVKITETATINIRVDSPEVKETEEEIKKKEVSKEKSEENKEKAAAQAAKEKEKLLAEREKAKEEERKAREKAKEDAAIAKEQARLEKEKQKTQIIKLKAKEKEEKLKAKEEARIAKEKERIAKEEMVKKLAQEAEEKARKAQEESAKAEKTVKQIEKTKEQEKAKQIAIKKEEDKTLKAKVSKDERTKLTEKEIAATVQIDIDDIDDIDEFLNQNK